MKKILPSLLIAFFLIHFASCEKDDICVDGDTPLIVVGFYDIEDTTVFKDVPSIRIRAVDNDQILSDSDAFRFSDRTNSPDSLSIPLQISTGSTQFEFISDSADDADTGEETGNIDQLTVNYAVREEFVSRACGFVAQFDNLSITLPESAENWIQDINVVQQTVENSNNIHVKIFH